MPKYECLAAIQFETVGVDASTGVIRGIKVIEMGPVNDTRPFIVDYETLKQVAELGNRPNRGTKSRWTHVEAVDSLGSHLGRFLNFRIEGNCVRADLHLAESARNSPKGDLHAYMLNIANEDPESCGASIAFLPDKELMRNEADGGRMPLRLSELYSVDIVGEPAATRGGLFSMENDMEDEVKPEDQAPEEKKPEMDFSFLSSEEMPVDEKIAKVAEMLGYDLPVKQECQDPEEMSCGPEKYLETFGDKGARWFLEKRPYVDCIAEAWTFEKQRTEELSKELDTLRVKLQAADSLRGEKEGLSVTLATDRGQLKTDAEIRLEKQQAKIQELMKRGVSERDAKWALAFNSK